MGVITWDLITFYSVFTVVFTFLYYKKINNEKLALLFSVMTVFVAREYWEIPIFVTGYLGFGNRFMPMLAHHVLVFIIFLILVNYSQIRFTKTLIALLITTPLFISPLILGTRSLYLTYLARTIGITVFGAVFIHGTSMVDA